MALYFIQLLDTNEHDFTGSAIASHVCAFDKICTVTSDYDYVRLLS